MHMDLLERRTLLAATVGIYASIPNASETDRLGTGRGEYIVKRSQDAIRQTWDLSYYVRVTSTAVEGKDFKALPGTLTMLPGKRTARISLYPTDDNLKENTETVEVLLKAPAGVTNIHSRATVKIADNDPVSTTVRVSASIPTASETDPSGAGKGQFLFERPAGSIDRALTVNYSTVGTSTAKNGVDFVKISGKVIIPAGQRSAAVDLVPIDDSIDEPIEKVTITLKDGDYVIIPGTASITIADNDDPPVPQGWWNTAYHYRAPISIDVGSHARSNHPVDVPINFTSILSSLGKSGALIDNSIRVIETNGDGTQVLDDHVPFQFDKSSSFNASSNASGTLVILLEGNTAASAVRKYHVYFDTAGSFTAPSFTPLVSTTDNVTDEGFTSIRIENQSATFFYQKAEGGFSSILDTNGNDWIGWKSTGGSDGEFRGVPNHGPIGFHPGRDNDIVTTIVSQGPLKTTLESTDSDGNKVRWEFYPTFARETVIQMDEDWWFLYEGTPGGSIDANDTVVRSDGTVTASNVEWTETNGLGSSNGEEWLYFRDSGVGADGRYFYFVHNTPDNIIDTYWEMEGNMTVFGFGRFTSMPDHNTSTPLMPSGANLNQVFTIGLADGGADFSAASALINGAYRDLAAMIGAASSI